MPSIHIHLPLPRERYRYIDTRLYFYLSTSIYIYSSVSSWLLMKKSGVSKRGAGKKYKSMHHSTTLVTHQPRAEKIYAIEEHRPRLSSPTLRWDSCKSSGSSDGSKSSFSIPTSRRSAVLPSQAKRGGSGEDGTPSPSVSASLFLQGVGVCRTREDGK